MVIVLGLRRSSHHLYSNIALSVPIHPCTPKFWSLCKERSTITPVLSKSSFSPTSDPRPTRPFFLSIIMSHVRGFLTLGLAFDPPCAYLSLFQPRRPCNETLTHFVKALHRRQVSLNCLTLMVIDKASHRLIRRELSHRIVCAILFI